MNYPYIYIYIYFFFFHNFPFLPFCANILKWINTFNTVWLNTYHCSHCFVCVSVCINIYIYIYWYINYPYIYIYWYINYPYIYIWVVDVSMCPMVWLKNVKNKKTNIANKTFSWKKIHFSLVICLLRFLYIFAMSHHSDCVLVQLVCISTAVHGIQTECCIPCGPLPAMRLM